MTELIVALDGPEPFDLTVRLAIELGICWFKVGPQTLTSGRVDTMMRAPRTEMQIFLDLKLADTGDTCREAAKRFGNAGIAALSTYTEEAADEAMRGAEGTPLRVWRVWRLTDSLAYLPISPIDLVGEGPRRLQQCQQGVICPVSTLVLPRARNIDADKICPGIRFPDGDPDGHKGDAATPQEAVAAGATHIVVGRPIWQASDPVAAAREFLAALTTDQK